MWRFAFVVLVACGGGQAPAPDAADNNVDDGGNVVVCVDDRSFEPNDAPANAFATGVGPRLARLSIIAALCPEPDTDLYRFEVTPDLRTVDALVTVEDGARLELSILATSGATILAGSPTGVVGEVSLVLSNAPVGELLVGVTGGGRHNYRLLFGVNP